MVAEVEVALQIPPASVHLDLVDPLPLMLAVLVDHITTQVEGLAPSQFLMVCTNNGKVTTYLASIHLLFNFGEKNCHYYCVL